VILLPCNQLTPDEHYARVRSSQYRRGILRALAAEPGMYVQAIASAIGRHPNQVGEQVISLRNDGLIVRASAATRWHDYMLTDMGAIVNSMLQGDSPKAPETSRFSG